ncbi:putative tubulin/FtsZ, GTPase domain superfamily [Helianthus anomalus]
MAKRCLMKCFSRGTTTISLITFFLDNQNELEYLNIRVEKCHAYLVSKLMFKYKRIEPQDRKHQFCNEPSPEKYVPRAIYVDFEPNINDKSKTRTYHLLFRSEQYSSDKEDIAVNFV